MCVTLRGGAAGMGAKCLFKVATDPESGAVQAERDLARRVEAHRGERAGPWEVTYAVWQHPERKRSNVDIVTTTEAPGQCLVVSGADVTSTGAQFVELMPKISGLQQRTVATIKGVEYDMKDFQVRLGRVFEKQNPSHVVIEVEYRPCLVVDDCLALIQELLDLFIKPSAGGGHGERGDEKPYEVTRIITDFKKTSLKDRHFFSLKHAAFLYTKLLTSG